MGPSWLKGMAAGAVSLTGVDEGGDAQLVLAEPGEPRPRVVSDTNAPTHAHTCNVVMKSR